MAAKIQLAGEVSGSSRNDIENLFFASFSPVSSSYLIWVGAAFDGVQLSKVRWMSQYLTLLDQRVGWNGNYESIWGLANPTNGPGQFYMQHAGGFIAETVQGAAIFYSGSTGINNLQILQQTQSGGAWSMGLDGNPLNNSSSLLTSYLHLTTGLDNANADAGDTLVIADPFGSGGYVSKQAYGGDGTMGWSYSSSTNTRKYTMRMWEMLAPIDIPQGGHPQLMFGS